ncbi:MAG: hypothetical protein ACREN0_11315, partial [Thermodesulfobacteriota bacterium]
MTVKLPLHVVLLWTHPSVMPALKIAGSVKLIMYASANVLLVSAFAGLPAPAAFDPSTKRLLARVLEANPIP